MDGKIVRTITIKQVDIAVEFYYSPGISADLYRGIPPALEEFEILSACLDDHPDFKFELNKKTIDLITDALVKLPPEAPERDFTVQNAA